MDINGPYSAAAFAEQTGVSSEMLEMFKKWEKLLTHWNKSINLVQKNSEAHYWERHALDSAQLFPYIPSTAINCLDLGSGAGFPGLAIAMFQKERGLDGPPAHVDLVEAIGKKCSFLRTVIRELNLPATAIQERAEKIEPKEYDLISARAFAPLPKLLEYSLPFWGPQTCGLFLKGRNFQAEIDGAKSNYLFDVTVHDSQSDPEGKIIIITNLTAL